MTAVEDWAHTEAKKRFPTMPEDRWGFKQGILHLAERLQSPEVVEAMALSVSLPRQTMALALAAALAAITKEEA